MTQLFVGLLAEGCTDHRFLIPVIERAFIDIVYDCSGQIDIDVKEVTCEKGTGFNEYVLNASKKAFQELGMTILIIHTDADDFSIKKAYESKIDPALKLIQEQPSHAYCKNIVALVPVFETESWMLADKTAFLKSINTKKSENELRIAGNPETFNNPKERIEEAIRIGRSDLPKKLRNKLKISDLYSFLGQSLQIEKLKQFQSFIDFESNIKQVLISLNLLPPKNNL